MKIKRKLVIEVIVVLLVFSTLCWVMLPRFMSNQTMVRINQNEKELQKLLDYLQTPGYKVGDEIVHKFLSNKVYQPYIHEYDHSASTKYISYFSFDLKYRDRFCLVHLGFSNDKDYQKAPKFNDTMDRLRVSDFNIGVFVVVNDIDAKIHSYFVRNSYVVGGDMVYMYYYPNPDKYFSITNGLNSSGMIYIDNQGRSWRDGQEQ